MIAEPIADPEVEMRKKRKPDQNLSLMANIMRQEIHVGSSGNGSTRYPLKVGTYMELAGQLAEPLKGSTDLAISISEIEGTLQERGLGHGMIFAVKPLVSLALWVDRPAMDRLVVLVTARRLTNFDAVADHTRYGQAIVHNWSLRTCPEEE